MKHSNDSAMSLGGIAFGMFCLVAAIAAGIYIITFNSNQPVVTDTYGNTIGPTANASQQLVTNLTSARRRWCVNTIGIDCSGHASDRLHCCNMDCKQNKMMRSVSNI